VAAAGKANKTEQKDGLHGDGEKREKREKRAANRKSS